ncbi:50S ribosomal protein L24e [Candidatus Woesearchaeota archaeon]|nr:50S ribosomal protein L24e [Candidatus Woesearchaeota archaeon]
MAKCEFCGKQITAGTGKLYVKKDGKTMYYCSTKCEKNQIKLGRKPRTTHWTTEYHAVKKGTKQ